MTDLELKALYTRAYCSKEAGAWDDFLNWLRQLFGMKRKNTPGEEIGAFGAGLGAAGAAGYGGVKGYRKAQNFLNNFNPSTASAFGKKIQPGLSKGIGYLRRMPKAGKLGLALGASVAIGDMSRRLYNHFVNKSNAFS